jgi:hypothetical protein
METEGLAAGWHVTSRSKSALTSSQSTLTPSPLDCPRSCIPETIDTVLLDFDDLVMAFNYNGKRVLWKGLGSSRCDISTTARLNSIQQQEDTVHDQVQTTIRQ